MRNSGEGGVILLDLWKFVVLGNYALGFQVQPLLV